MFMYHETGQRIGASVGRFARMEEKKHGMHLGASLKVRVLIDISKPLPRVASVRLLREKRTSLLEIDYVRLHMFCQYCGLLRMFLIDVMLSRRV